MCTSMCVLVKTVRLRECTRLSLLVRASVQTGVCGLFYVPPIINNIFTVDMSAFLPVFGFLIYIVFLETFLSAL